MNAVNAASSVLELSSGKYRKFYGDIMGSVRVFARVTPEEPDKFDEMKAAVEALKPDHMETEDIGFGVKALKLVKVVPEEDGAMPKFEEALENIPNANSEIINVDRM